MGVLLDKVRKMADAEIWRPSEKGDGIEGVVTEIKIVTGNFNSTHYLICLDDGGEVIVPAAEGSVIAKKLDELRVIVGDRIAVVFKGQPVGKKYKDWEVGVER